MGLVLPGLFSEVLPFGFKFDTVLLSLAEVILALLPLGGDDRAILFERPSRFSQLALQLFRIWLRVPPIGV